MRRTFAYAPSPMLAGVIREKTVKSAIAEIKNCEYHGATGIDLHLSCLEDEYKNTESIREIINSCRIPIMSLNYDMTYGWQRIGSTEEERVELLMKSVDAGIDCVDIQSYTYDYDSQNTFRTEFADKRYSFIVDGIKELVLDKKVIDKQCELIKRIHAKGAEVLLSSHPLVEMTCEQVVDYAHFLEERKPDVIKIVAMAETEEQLAEAFKTMLTLKKEVRTVTHYHCNGRFGNLTRIINPVLGGHLIFCVDRYTEGSTVVQLDLQTAKSVLDGLKSIEEI